MSSAASSASALSKELDEDIYMDALAAIIERDFFPNLAKYRAQGEYLDALEKNDMGRLQQLSAKLARMTQTPGATPGQSTPRLPFATPLMSSTPGGSVTHHHGSAGLAAAAAVVNQERDERLRAAGVDINNISLEAFQETFTSEDDASFEKLVARLNHKHRERYHWLYEQKDRLRSDRLLEAGPSNVKGLLTASGETASQTGAAADSAGTPQQTTPQPPGVAVQEDKSIEFWDYKARNTLMYYPEGSPLTEKERLHATYNRAEINYDVFKIPLPVHRPSSAALGAAAAANTSDTNEIARFIQRKAMQQGAYTPSARTPAPLSATPQIAGYGFVPATPTMIPGVDATPMMTWGMIEGTPLLLDPTMTPLRPGDPHFHMQVQSERERIANKLTDEIAKKHRSKNSTSVNAAAKLEKLKASPSIQSSLPQSPVTSRLLSNDSQLRASYSSPFSSSPARTPSNRAITTPGSGRTPRLSSGIAGKKAGAAAASTPTAASKSGSSLTDDLLQI